MALPPIGAGMLAMGAMGLLLLGLHQISPIPLVAIPLITIVEVVVFIAGAAFLGADDEDDSVPPGMVL